MHQIVDSLARSLSLVLPSLSVCLDTSLRRAYTDKWPVANPELSPESLSPKTQCQEDDSRRFVNLFPLPH